MGEVMDFLNEWDPEGEVEAWVPRKEIARPSGLRRVDMGIFGAGVYILIYKERTMYVGSSARLMQRLGQHFYKGTIVFDEIKIIPCKKEELRVCERAAVRRYKPQLNRGTGFGREKFTFEQLGIDIHKLIREGKPSWRRI
jgi:GIY-YIG catalytic domain